jgi:hypothetical protein
MALLAEEIVEEWLNRKGYFTIRGINLGVHEIDLLAVKAHPGGATEARHIEVQASMRPVSYISRVPRMLQRSGRAANSVRRSDDELKEGVAEWVQTKFRRPDKKALMARLWPGAWSSELVVNVFKSQPELDLIESQGIKLITLAKIVSDLTENKDFIISSASGGAIVDLIRLATVPRDVPARAPNGPVPAASA